MKSLIQHAKDIAQGTGQILSIMLEVPKWCLLAILSILALLVGMVTVLAIGLIVGLTEAQEGLSQKRHGE